MPDQVKWQGKLPEFCQLCGLKLKDHFVDGSTIYGGSWAIMCVGCHIHKGHGIGPGRGQQYELPSGIKVRG